MYNRIFKKKPNIVSMEWGRDFFRIFHPLQWKVHNRNLCMVRSWFNDIEDEKVNVFLNANLWEQKEVVHMWNNLYQTVSQHWQPFYSWKMAPLHVCVGRWKTSMNGRKNINTTFQTNQKRWDWPTSWFLFFYFLPSFIISISRWVI